MAPSKEQRNESVSHDRNTLLAHRVLVLAREGGRGVPTKNAKSNPVAGITVEPRPPQPTQESCPEYWQKFQNLPKRKQRRWRRRCQLDAAKQRQEAAQREAVVLPPPIPGQVRICKPGVMSVVGRDGATYFYTLDPRLDPVHFYIYIRQ